MKQKKITQKMKLLLVLAFAMLVGQNAMAVDIVSYDLTTDFASTSGLAANHPSGLMSTTASGISFAGSNARTTGWDSGTPGGYKSLETSAFSTVGHYNVVVNASMSSQATGPRDFALEYKVGAGGTWTSAGSMTLTAASVNYPNTLPLACNNQPVVYVRWIATSYINLDGNPVTAASRNYLVTVTIVGDEPVIPSTQAKAIKFVSITPTTITMSCTPGNGDRRIVVMNTTNTFTDPTNDQIFPADADYKGSEQVVYNGTGSTVLVTVPSSTNQYWFRVYDYKYNGGMIRYITSTFPPANPKLCALAIITANAATNIKLISATLGATIASSPSGIVDRGIVWNTTGNVQDTQNDAIEGGSSTGSYSLNFPDGANGFPNMPRGTRIYFKGWVENGSGKIYSNELSFTNVPEFTGSGTWETAARWNVQEVPGSTGPANFGSNGSVLDSPIIKGTCTLGATNSVTNLTVTSGSLAINTATTMNVVGTLTNSVGNSGLLIKSAEGVANGSLIWATGNPQGTVQMYSKAYQDTKYHWQYFGIPVTSTTVGTTFSGTSVRVRKYDETNADPTHLDVGLWKPAGNGATMAAGEALIPVDGYEVTQPSARTYTFTGTLNHDAISKSLAYTVAADWTGNHILANPYTAAINIAGISYTNTESNVYLYNAGSRDEWNAPYNPLTNNDGLNHDGTSPGQYTVSNGAYSGTLGVTAQIPSMQGFLVKAMSAGASISIPYSAVMSNTTAQRAKSDVVTEKTGTRIDVLGATYTDRMWIFTEPDCTRSFNNGFDGPKLLGSALTPQIFGMEADGNYQINAVSDMNDSYLGFQAGSDTDYKLIFTHQNLDTKYSSVYLVDLQENKSVDVTATGSEYAFTATTTPTATKRFKIVTIANGTTGLNATPSQIKIFNTQGAVYVQNSSANEGTFVLYNMSGSAIKTVKVAANGLTTIPLNMGAGSFVAKVQTDLEKITERLIIR